jgi:2-polyprenyl-3-methyl-5-hydroxy-6-metoxy-1,4-benzoquinol methylase
MAASADMPEFVNQNVRLDNGNFTRPDDKTHMGEDPRFLAAMRTLDAIFGPDKSGLRIADLGCLEGGYTLEFARAGFTAVGVEIRAGHIAACDYLKANTDLPGLSYVQDDVWNIADHGTFDAIYCSGLLYHLDEPKRFLDLLASVTTKVLLLSTHFAVDASWIDRIRKRGYKARRLGPMTTHEGLRGRWYMEFADDEAFANRAKAKFAAWDNRRSFWIKHEWLLDAINQAGFGLVYEQFDNLTPNIALGMTSGEYATYNRGMFVGVKS